MKRINFLVVIILSLSFLFSLMPQAGAQAVNDKLSMTASPGLQYNLCHGCSGKQSKQSRKESRLEQKMKDAFISIRNRNEQKETFLGKPAQIEITVQK